jgi:hypothetical protein
MTALLKSVAAGHAAVFSGKRGKRGFAYLEICT